MVGPLVIVVDPGHGGPQSFGAMWPPCIIPEGTGPVDMQRMLAEHAKHAQAVEKDINLCIALALAHALEGTGRPVVAELTREDDEALGLDARAAIGAKHGADMVVSIHCDTNADPKVQGLWTYVREGDKPAYDFARDVMLSVNRELRRGSSEPTIAKPQPHWTGRAHAVLGYHQGPAVLVECGFLSNDGDRALLTSEPGQAMVVDAVTAAVSGLWWRRTAQSK